MNYGLYMVMLILFIFSIYHSYTIDHENMETGNNSRVKKTLVACRDSAMRGAMIGCMMGSWPAALHNAAIWTMYSGISTSLSETMNWKPHF